MVGIKLREAENRESQGGGARALGRGRRGQGYSREGGQEGEAGIYKTTITWVSSARLTLIASFSVSYLQHYLVTSLKNRSYPAVLPRDLSLVSPSLATF